MMCEEVPTVLVLMSEMLLPMYAGHLAVHIIMLT